MKVLLGVSGETESVWDRQEEQTGQPQAKGRGLPPPHGEKGQGCSVQERLVQLPGKNQKEKTARGGSHRQVANPSVAPPYLQDSISDSPIQQLTCQDLASPSFSASWAIGLPWSPAPGLQLPACLAWPYPYPSLYFLSLCSRSLYPSKAGLAFKAADILPPNEPLRFLLLTSRPLHVQRVPAQLLSQPGPELAMAQQWPCLFLPSSQSSRVLETWASVFAQGPVPALLYHTLN